MLPVSFAPLLSKEGQGWLSSWDVTALDPGCLIENRLTGRSVIGRKNEIVAKSLNLSSH